MATPEIALLSLFKDKILKTIKITKEELSNFFDDGLHDYLETQRKNHQNLKTFIFRDKSMRFDKVYFPVEFSSDEERLTDLDVINLTKNVGTIAIIGNAGSGKTMFVSKLFLEYVKSKEKVPIVIKLRHFNNYSGSFTNYIYEKILNNKVHPSKRILERVLENGNFIFILDGYDEIYSANKQKLTREINDFIDIYNSNSFIITSRPGTSLEYYDKFTNLEVESLSRKQVEEFIYQQAKLMDDDLLGNKIIDTIKKPENDDYKDYLSNPLLLSMFIYTYKHYPEIPKKKSKFYYYVWKTLCFDHDSVNKKEGHIQDRTSGLTTDEIEEIVKWFSFIALMDGQFSFEEDYLEKTIKVIKKENGLNFEVSKLIYDLRTSLSILVLDGVEYRFPHKSIQEYFAALMIFSFSDHYKKDLYQNHFPQFQKHSDVGGFYNFYKLCEEIDNVCFKSYCLLPILRKFNQETQGLIKVNKFRKIIELYPLVLSGEYVNRTNDYEINTYGYFGDSSSDPFLVAILRFVGVSGYLFKKGDFKFEKLPKNSIKRKHKYDSYLTLFNEEGTHSFSLVVYKNFNVEMYKICNNIGLVNKAIILLKELNKKISLLEAEIEKESNKIQNLIKKI